MLPLVAEQLCGTWAANLGHFATASIYPAGMLLRTLLTTAALALLLAACGGNEKPPKPPPEPQPAGPTPEEQLQDLLVQAHTSAIEECFGGFGKGVPYAVELKLDRAGKVTEAKVGELSPDGPMVPKSMCIQQYYRRLDAPSQHGKDASVSVKAGVKNDACERPECPPNNLACVFKADIRCSVVADVKLEQ